MLGFSLRLFIETFLHILTEIEKSELLIKKEDPSDLNKSETPSKTDDIKEENPLPIDWKPQDKCYFCVDGKLLTVNEAGELVAESGPVQTTEADLTNNRVSISLMFCVFETLIYSYDTMCLDERF